jgi:membrane fusion protein
VSRQLFRHEALDFFSQHQQLGGVALLQPLSVKVMAWLLVAVVVGAGIFLSIAEYARKETAPGYVTPASGTAKIYVPHRGTIREVHVEEGALVTPDQPLLTIETDLIAADGTDVHGAMLETLATQRDMLQSNIAAEQLRATSESDRLEGRITGLEFEVSELRAQVRYQQERLGVAETELAAAEKLHARGFMSAAEVQRRQTQVLEQRQALSALQQNASAKDNELSEARFSLTQLPTVIEQNLQRVRSDLSATEQRMSEIQGRRAYVIRAPTAGRVSTLQATVGQSADPQRLQLELVPEGVPLQAELFVPTRAIGFIEVGQSVRIMYDAFPYQHFGTYGGQVMRVAQTIVTSSDVTGPVALHAPAYRVTVALDQPHVEANGRTVMLQPDILLSADIILERRSLLDWLLSPLRSMRT